MAQKEEWEMEWRSVFEDKLSPSPTSPSKPTAKMVSHGLANTLDRIFRNYSPPSEGSSVRIMPAASFVRMATECYFMDDKFTLKQLYHIVSKHATQLVKSRTGNECHAKRDFGEEGADPTFPDFVRAGLTFEGFIRVLQEIGDVKQGPGKNGLHRLVYLNIIRFASSGGSPETKNPHPPKTAMSLIRRDGLQDPLLRMVLENVQTGVTTVQAREIMDDCKSKWAEVPKTGNEVKLVQKHFANIFSDVVEAFVFFDLQGNDIITMHEFRRGIQRLKLTDVNLERVMREVDMSCKRHVGEDIDLISFIRIFAWHPVIEMAEWIRKYEKTKVAGDAIVRRIRELVRKRAQPALPCEVDLDLITACSVLGTKWDLVRRCFLSAGKMGSSKLYWSPSSPNRRSLSPPQSARDRAWSEGLRSDSKNDRYRGDRNATGEVGRRINAIGKQDFLEALSKIPLDLTPEQTEKAFNLLDVDKNGWFRISQAEQTLRKAGYLPRINTSKSSSTTNATKLSQEAIMHEMMSVECERTVALSALADQWTARELDLVNSRHKERLINVLTTEEQVRFDRSTAAAQKSLTKAMEQQFASINELFDERVKRLRPQLSASARAMCDAKKSSSNKSIGGEPKGTSPANVSASTGPKTETVAEDVQFQTSLSIRSTSRPAIDIRMKFVDGFPSHSLQQSLRRKVRNSSVLKAGGWMELLNQFDHNHDGFLDFGDFFEAVQQACTQSKSPELNEDTTSHDRRRRASKSVTADNLSAIVRILDASSEGKVRIDAFVDFLFNSTAQQVQSARSAKLQSPSMTQEHLSDLESFDGMSNIPVLRSTGTAVHMSTVRDMGAKNLFSGAEHISDHTSVHEKTLDPWPRQKQLENVFVPDESLSIDKNSRKKNKVESKLLCASPMHKGSRSAFSSTAAFALSDIPSKLLAQERQGTDYSPEKFRMNRSTSAPPRTHTPKGHRFYFADEAPGAQFRKQPATSPRRARRPWKKSPMTVENTSILEPNEELPQNADDFIRAWLHHRPLSAGDCSDSEIEALSLGIEAVKLGEQSSPKLLSSRDLMNTNGWIVSTASPTEGVNGKHRRRERPDSRRNGSRAVASSSDTSSEEHHGRRERGHSQSPKKRSTFEEYHEMQQRIRNKLRHEWGASESESDDSRELHMTDREFKKRTEKKSTRLSLFSKQSALQMLGNGSGANKIPTTPRDSRPVDDSRGSPLNGKEDSRDASNVPKSPKRSRVVHPKSRLFDTKFARTDPRLHKKVPSPSKSPPNRSPGGWAAATRTKPSISPNKLTEDLKALYWEND